MNRTRLIYVPISICALALTGALAVAGCGGGQSRPRSYSPSGAPVRPAARVYRTPDRSTAAAEIAPVNRYLGAAAARNGRAACAQLTGTAQHEVAAEANQTGGPIAQRCVRALDAHRSAHAFPAATRASAQAAHGRGFVALSYRGAGTNATFTVIQMGGAWKIDGIPGQD